MYDVLVKKGNPDRARCEVELGVRAAVTHIVEHGTLPDREYRFDIGGPDSCNPHVATPAEEVNAKLYRLQRRGLNIVAGLENVNAKVILIEAFRKHLLNEEPLLAILYVDWEKFRPGSRPYLTGGVLPSNALNPTDAKAHALVVVGYDDTRQLFKVLNSAGPEWGADGYAFIDYSSFVGSLERSAVYYLSRPKEIATGVFIDIEVKVDKATMTLDLQAIGKFLDYIPPRAHLSIFASRTDCKSPSCRVQLATRAIEPTEMYQNSFAVKQFSVPFDTPTMAPMRNATVFVSSAVVFAGEREMLEAEIFKDRAHFAEEAVQLP